MWWKCFSMGLFMLISGVYSSGCPPPEEITPCTCSPDKGYIVCKNVSDTNLLIQVAQNADGYEYDGFFLTDCTLQYMPQQFMNAKRLRKLTLLRVTLINMFDEVPNNTQVTMLDFEEVRAMGGWDWSEFSNFNNLELLYLAKISMPRITDQFKTTFANKLRTLYLHDMDIKNLDDEVFQNFTELQDIGLFNIKLEALKRSWFPRPSKLKQMTFSGTGITSIPDDFFEDMKEIFFVTFRDNQIASLSEELFKPTYRNHSLRTVHLQGNPFKCDCKMEWIVKREKPVPFIDGNCETPKKLNGKPLYELSEYDFNC